MPQTLPELIAATRELRALPATTGRLMHLLDDATAGADEVLEVIGTDPSLTANLLKLCNSAYYGLRRQVGTVREALVMLGNRTVVSLAFAASMGDVLRGPLAAYRLARDEFWHHALATAVGAAHLVPEAAARGPRERAFTGGLVHDIGKLLLNAPLKEALQQLPTTADHVALLRAEYDILGFDHAQAGAALGEAWNFPPALVAVVAHHHAPGYLADAEPVDALVLRAVCGANLAACRLGFCGGTSELADDVFTGRMDDLGFAPDVVVSLLARVPVDVAGLIGPLGGEV